MLHTDSQYLSTCHNHKETSTNDAIHLHYSLAYQIAKLNTYRYWIQSLLTQVILSVSTGSEDETEVTSTTGFTTDRTSDVDERRTLEEDDDDEEDEEEDTEDEM